LVSQYFNFIFYPIKLKCIKYNLLFKVTEYSSHAKDIIKDLDLKSYDAIVTVSGDGIIHEVINGLLSRSDALEIDIPIGVIPSGEFLILIIRVFILLFH
jgi:diacylglycerol kinase family enzyme